MKFTLPIYCERTGDEKNGESFAVRLLFAPEVEAVRPELKRATDALAAAARKLLQHNSAEARHEVLASIAFAPELEEHVVTVPITLRRRSFKVPYLFAVMSVGARRVALTPRLPALAFEYARGEDLSARASEVLTAWFRKLERDDEEEIDPAKDGVKGSAWLGSLDLNVDVDATWQPARDDKRAELGTFAAMNGSEQLARVGRLLNARYPDDLDRAIDREDEVTELMRLLREKHARPLVLRGQAGAGKTAVIHEALRRLIGQRGTQSDRNQVWLVSPQRLISGMMFVGQWENRLHAILAECRRRNHVLYFDDLVGLFRAGISASSKVSVAEVLKPHLERREVRVLAEATPGQWRVLAELDRSFADLFHALMIEPSSGERTMRIMLHQQRELEARTGCEFDLEALPTTLDLSSRYRRDQALPGSAAGFLRQVAIKRRGKPVTRRDVLHEFEARSGLSVTFLDEQQRLSRDDIRQGLTRRVVGQQRAVDAICDVVSIAKARLNDPGKPLGSLLFLGPTGVGKTECAKALAASLYGSAERLLRFDMNEYPDAGAVARLAGTLAEPEGLLTGAVRRQPFAVILLDEIEKAHPAAFDLLLQVLGEGRLTDALGRTADFSNCIIVLTSNLGAQEAAGGLGVAGHDMRGDAVYVAAARRFFRPEFFNRLDHVVPFERLGREQVGAIARHLLRDVLAREGLARRRCILRVTPAAMERVIDQGFHPALGARAIKRELERQLTVPLATRLAAMAPGVPVVVALAAGGDGIDVSTSELAGARYAPDAAARLLGMPSDEAIALIDRLLNHAEKRVADEAPKGAISGSDVSPALRRYFAIKALVEQLDRAVESYLDWRERRTGRAQQAEYVRVEPGAWLAVNSATDARNLLAQGAEPDEGEARMLRLAGSAALLVQMLATPAQPDERALLVVERLGGLYSRDELQGTLSALLRHRFELGVDFKPGEDRREIVVSGYLAQALTRALEGVYLHVDGSGLTPLGVRAAALAPGQDPAAVADALPAAPQFPVMRVSVGSGLALDVRGSMLSREYPPLALLQQWLLAAMPLPEGPWA
ncbi:MAG: AAA family ATPase [Planctomycetes bacterium]|nr:AAA family ATPase [Planctomycetota bacterium]MCW8135829.1 AAA family ATPase [Planctomycetota bacterium]